MTAILPETPRSGRLRTAWRTVRDALAGVSHDHTTGSLHRSIVLLAVPMVLEMAMESTFAVVDVWFVARLGNEAIATVGLTESVITVLYGVAVGLSMATTATVARRVGERDLPGAVTAATQAVALGLALSAVVGVLGVAHGGDVLRLMGADAAVLAVGGDYARVLFGSNVVILLLFLNNAVFRGAGDALVAMRALWLANGLNIVLDPCLIFGLGPFPELGLTGAAVATTIGRGTGVLYQFHCLRNGASRVQLRGPAFRLDLGVMLRLLRVSAGGVMQFLVATASWIALTRIVAVFGSATVAGYTVAIRIAMFVFLPAWGLSNAAATLVGQNLGAARPDRAERAVWLTGLYNMAFLGAVTVFFVGGAGTLAALFTTEPEVLPVATRCLRTLSYGYVFYAWGMVMVQAFNGAGDTMTPTWINLACFWCWQIPMAWALARPLGQGPDGVFWSIAVCESALAVVALLLFRRGRWKERRV